MVSNRDAKRVAKALNIDLRRLPLKQWKYALEVEMEHGFRSPLTNVTDDDLITTGKIALAHILEYPDYYERLKQMEHDAALFWKSRRKPNIFRTNSS